MHVVIIKRWSLGGESVHVPRIFHSRVFQTGLGVLLVFLIILVGQQIAFIFQPIMVVFNTLFFPFLIAGFLYFLLDPVVDWLQAHRIPRWCSVLVLYLMVALLLFFLFTTLGSALYREIERLIRDIPRQLDQLQAIIVSLQENPFVHQWMQEEPQFIDKAADQITTYLERLVTSLAGGVGRIFGSAAEAFLVVVAIPFILFYMLRDGQYWPTTFLDAVPEQHRRDISIVLKDVKWAVSSYIQGIVLICLSVGVLVYIGYRIIGLDYPLLLAFFSMITNVIPFLGPFIGSTLPIMFALLTKDSLWYPFGVFLAFYVIQLAESNFFTPKIVGGKVSMNPFMTILALFVGNFIWGLAGMILFIPGMAILKVIFDEIPGMEPYGFLLGHARTTAKEKTDRRGLRDQIRSVRGRFRI